MLFLATQEDRAFYIVANKNFGSQRKLIIDERRIIEHNCLDLLGLKHR